MSNLVKNTRKIFTDSSINTGGGGGSYVPYIGATGNVDLGTNTIIANAFIKNGGTSVQFLKADGSVDTNTYITSAVTSVSGTTNRITSTGGSTPVIDISASYVGQSSITTLGTIATGVWQGTSINTTYTDAKIKGSASVSGGLLYQSATDSATTSSNMVYDGATLTITGTGSDILTVLGSGTGGQRSGIRVNASSSAGQATNYMFNDRNSTASYGGQLYGGQSNVVGNLFGVSRADKYFIFADGANNLGMAIGTLSAQVLILGTNNTERYKISGGSTHTFTGQIIVNGGSTGAYGLSVNSTATPLEVASNNSNGTKIALSDATTVRGYIGAGSTDAFTIWDNAAAGIKFRIDSSGNLKNLNKAYFGSATTTPTALIHTNAGTAAANTAPIQITVGVSETAARSGLVQFSSSSSSGIQTISGSRFTLTESDLVERFILQAATSVKTTAGAPYTNDGYITVVINGTSIKLMTTA